MPDAPLILAFDTSAAHCAAAVVQGDRVLARAVELMGRGQAERLPLLVQETLGEAGTTLSDIDRIGVGIGPGNFTGVRISVAFARGLSLSLKRPAVGVSRFEALLEEAAADNLPALVAVQGKRGQLSVQAFDADGRPDGAPVTALPEDLARRFSGFDGMVVGAGKELSESLGCIFRAGGMPDADGPDPVAIAKVAARRADFSERPAPVYLRPADAAPSSDLPPRILK